MKRVKFRKGDQRKFLKEVLEKTNCPSLRAISQFGFEIPYSTLKNYFSELRTLPEDFFRDLCKFSGVDLKKFNFEYFNENWGQIKGGGK